MMTFDEYYKYPSTYKNYIEAIRDDKLLTANSLLYDLLKAEQYEEIKIMILLCMKANYREMLAKDFESRKEYYEAEMEKYK